MKSSGDLKAYTLFCAILIGPYKRYCVDFVTSLSLRCTSKFTPTIPISWQNSLLDSRSQLSQNSRLILERGMCTICTCWDALLCGCFLQQKLHWYFPTLHSMFILRVTDPRIGLAYPSTALERLGERPISLHAIWRQLCRKAKRNEEPLSSSRKKYIPNVFHQEKKC